MSAPDRLYFLLLSTHTYCYPAFIVKQNTRIFPKEALYAVLKARHSKRPAGHWVVMKTNIAGVDLFARLVAVKCDVHGLYLWQGEEYYAKFSDGYDNKETLAYPRPAIVHQTYHFLPLIDEFNKERQKVLALEKKWPTRNCWTRCITSMTGQCVVDLMRWDRPKRASLAIGYTEAYKEWDITEMALSPTGELLGREEL